MGTCDSPILRVIDDKATLKLLDPRGIHIHGRTLVRGEDKLGVLMPVTEPGIGIFAAGTGGDEVHVNPVAEGMSDVIHELEAFGAFAILLVVVNENLHVGRYAAHWVFNVLVDVEAEWVETTRHEVVGGALPSGYRKDPTKSDEDRAQKSEIDSILHVEN